jgi:hypothetical protein
MKEDWALCVGIEHYAATKFLPPLPGAFNDAKAIHAWLVDADGGDVPGEQAKLILSALPNNADGGSPTSAEIEKFLGGLYLRASAANAAGENFRAGRRLWLYYSGHGLGFPTEKDTGLLTADAQPPMYPHVAGLAWAEVFQASTAFDEVVLLMDCCRTEANRIPLMRPALSVYVPAAQQSRLIAAYAVAKDKPAYEVTDAKGEPRGKFTIVLEKLLRDPPERPLSAKRFIELLDQRHAGLAARAPNVKAEDFELLSGAKAAPPSVLIAHGETTFGLAQQLAGTFPSKAIVTWAGNVMNEPAARFEPIRDLIVTRNLDLAGLSALVDHVKPRRTIMLGERDPGVSVLTGVRFLPRDAQPEPQSARYAHEIEQALAGFKGTLVVQAHEPVAHLRVWDDAGRVVGEGYGRLRLELPIGPYSVRASLGPLYTEESAALTLGEETTVTLPPLVAAVAPQRELARLEPAPEDRPKRIQVRVQMAARQIAFSVPTLPGWTTIVSSTGDGVPSLAVRMLPPGSAPHAALVTDAAREALRLALAAPAWYAPAPAARELAGDPIALLLAAALQLRNGAPAQEYVDAAAALLGDDDVDVRLLRDGATVADPPLLVWLWQRRLEEGKLQVEPKSVAEGVVGLLCATDPWFGWSLGEQAPEGVWVAQLASVAWPGWNAEPDPSLARAHLEATCVAVGAPVSSIRARLAAKSPPIDRLVQHQRAAFVGASNDQLAAALVVAFVQRERRPWEQIDVWSLTDAPLGTMVSAGRTGPPLLAARDRAEVQLKDLLKLVAKTWSVRRYDGLLVGGRPHFASLWDWMAPKGYVHVSPRTQTDVRTSERDDLIWAGAQPDPRYLEVVRAYEALAASHRE